MDTEVDVLGHAARQCRQRRHHDFSAGMGVTRRLRTAKRGPVGIAGGLHPCAGRHGRQVARPPVRTGTAQTKWGDRNPHGLQGASQAGLIGEHHVRTGHEPFVELIEHCHPGAFNAPAHISRRVVRLDRNDVGAEIGQGATRKARPLVGEIEDPQIIEKAGHGGDTKARRCTLGSLHRGSRGPPLGAVGQRGEATLTGSSGSVANPARRLRPGDAADLAGSGRRVAKSGVNS